MSLRILLQSPFLADMVLVEVPDGSSFDAVRHAALEAIPQAHRSPENEVTVEPDEDDHGNGLGKAEAKVKDGMRVHVSRCKKVAVVVRFMGQPPASHEFPPANRVKRVKDWAVKEFKIADAEAARHGLYIPGSDKELGADVQIGALVQDGTCAVTLDLLPTERIHGV